MVPGLDEKMGKRVPQQLLHPVKEIELIGIRIKIFYSIRYMIFHLIQNDGETSLRLKENPIKRDEREIAKWTVGNSYEVSTEIELVLCNVRINQKMSVRYVIIDQDFFLLVEPDFSKNGEYRVKVHIKQPLKMVESMIDRTEPRNLIIGLVILQKNEVKVSQLFFYNSL
jgi:hypothetical protein